MKLHNLSNPKGAKHATKRLGCGVGSGHGKTSGKGHKGMKARSGGGVRPGFEGGQMPLYRKLPHRGFNNYRFRVEYATVNLASLELFDLEEVTKLDMIIAGFVRPNAKLVKVLGLGKLTKKMTVVADKFSASAKAAIEAAGGKAVLTSEVVVEATEASE